MKVLYEDNHLLVVEKPAGLLTQPSGTDQPSLEVISKTYIKEKYNKSGNVFLEAVHRLDKPVGGIVLFARTSKALSRLQASMRAKQCSKTYWAMVEGVVPSSEGVLEHYLLHDDHQSLIVAKSNPNGKLAKLKYRFLGYLRENNWLEIDLDTGRYHQIRAQLAEIGCPIVGDHKYGSRIAFMPNCIALHHVQMTVRHPVSDALLSFKSPPEWVAN